MPSLFESRRTAVRDRARFAFERCQKAASAGGLGPAGLLTSNQSMMQSQGRRRIEDSKEQLQHIRGQAYISIRPIAQRIAGQAIRVARIANRPSSRRSRIIEPRQFSLPKWIESLAVKNLDNLQVLDQHPILDAIHCPSGIQTDWALKWVTVASLESTGWAYWWFPKVKGKTQIWHVPTSWVIPEHDGGLFSSWTLRPDGGQVTETVPGDKIAPFWYPSPANPIMSISPMEAGAKELLVHEYIVEAQRSTFARGLHPGTLVKIRKKGINGGKDMARPRLRKWQRNQVLERINEEIRGMLHYGDPFIMGDDIESIDSFGNKPEEMDFAQSGSVAQARVEQIFGTNPYIAGAKGGGSRAEAAEADGQFCYNTVNPKIELLGRVMTVAVVPQFDTSGTLLMFIEPCRPRDTEMELKEWQIGSTFGGYTVNEWRNNVARLPSVPWGEERVQVARTTVTDSDGSPPPTLPAPTPANDEGPDDETNNPPDDDSDQGDESGGDKSRRSTRREHTKNTGPTQQAEFLGAWLRSHESYEPAMAEAIMRFFRVQKQDVVKRLSALFESRRDAAGTVEKNHAEALGLSLIAPHEWVGEFKQTVQPEMVKTMLAGANLELTAANAKRLRSHRDVQRRDVLVDIGHDVGIGFPDDVARGIEGELARILEQGYWQDIQQTTRERLASNVQQGVLAGETLRQLVARIEPLFTGPAARDRATLIARTETTGSLNAGQEEARVWLEREGVIEGKEWFATTDMRTRPTHLTANGQIRKVAESFDVGGYKARYPGDFSLPAKERCNCRCASASVTEFSSVRSVRSALIVPYWAACSLHGLAA